MRSLYIIERAIPLRRKNDENMKTKITINHNGFHGYNARSIVVDGKPGERVELSCSQVKKLERAGCGCSDCKCGESLLAACEIPEPWMPDSPVFLTIPTEGNEISVRGNYPQH